MWTPAQNQNLHCIISPILAVIFWHADSKSSLVFFVKSSFRLVLFRECHYSLAALLSAKCCRSTPASKQTTPCDVTRSGSPITITSPLRQRSQVAQGRRCCKGCILTTLHNASPTRLVFHSRHQIWFPNFINFPLRSAQWRPGFDETRRCLHKNKARF